MVSDIFVYRDESAQYRVWPPVFVTSAPRIVVFRNFTADDATVTLTFDPPAVARDGAKPLTGEGGKRGSKAVFIVPALGNREVPIPGAVAKGVYAYHVAVGPFHAVGGSEPRIIID